MKKLNLKSRMSGWAFNLKKNSPEILVVGGIVGVLTSAVLACVATTKLNTVSEPVKAKTEAIRKKEEALLAKADEETTLTVRQETKKELTRAYFQAGLGYARLYAPSVTLGAMSVTGILAGHNLLKKRHVTLAAAYTAIDTGFKKYRCGVVERYGEEVDQELRHGLKREKIEETVTDENGKTVRTKKTVAVAESGMPSDYARYFAHGDAKAWEPNDDYNRMFLNSQQTLANHLLRANRYLFLNDVYDMLGIDRSIAGQTVGWVYDKDSDGNDNYVDFGICEAYRKNSEADGGYEKVWLLDFNVDGDILSHSLDKGLITV